MKLMSTWKTEAAGPGGMHPAVVQPLMDLLTASATQFYDVSLKHEHLV